MSSVGTIRVMMVDDHPIVRDGLVGVLEQAGGFEVVGHASDGAEAVRTAGELKPQVIIMDVMMPQKDGIDACREIMELLPETRVLMLTASMEEDAVVEAVAAGAAGYLQKYSDRDELLEAVREVAGGRLRLPDDTVRRVFLSIREDRFPESQQGLGLLSEREQEVLRMFAAGMSYADIARRSGNSPTTVRNTVYRVQDKLGVCSKQEMVVWAVRNGLLDEGG